MHICNAFESSQRWLYDFSFIFPLDGDDSVHLQAGYPLSCKLRSCPPPSIAQGGTRHRTSTPQTREHGSHTQADVHRVYITRTPIHNPMSISVWKEKEREKLKIPRASYFPGTCSSATASVVLRALDERTLRVTASRCREAPLPRPLRWSHSLSWDLHVLRRGASATGTSLNERNEDVSLCHVAS